MKIKLAMPPIGIKIDRDDADISSLKSKVRIKTYSGPSYCDAIRRAGLGENIRVGPGSIQVCRWSPPVLGLKEAETDFEREREPKLPFRASGILIARMDSWPKEAGSPDVVIIRAGRDAFRALLCSMDPDLLYAEHTGVDRTVVPALTGGKSSPVKMALVRSTNRALGWLNRFPAWTRLTIWAFRREWSSRMLNFFLDRSMANMSMCRNSTVIPLLSGRINVSHFCTGGISWGKNEPQLMTCGMPHDIYQSVADKLET